MYVYVCSIVFMSISPRMYVCMYEHVLYVCIYYIYVCM